MAGPHDHEFEQPIQRDVMYDYATEKKYIDTYQDGCQRIVIQTRPA